MKILHINYLDVEGGAAKAMYRLHKALNRTERASRLLVGRKTICESNIETIIEQSGRIGAVINKALDLVGKKIEWRFGISFLSNRESLEIHKADIFKKSNVINIHNLHGGYFNIHALPKMANIKPIVWTLHDMNSFTGHCAFSYDCEKFVGGCDHTCPIPYDYPAVKPNFIKNNWSRHIKVINSSNSLTAVCPSRWLANEAKKGIWRNHRLEIIPYGLDINIFKPLNKKSAREALGIPIEGNYILFGAHTINDPRKGAVYLIESLNNIKTENLSLLIYGQGDRLKTQNNVRIPIISLGKIQEEKKMRLVYCASDIFAMPSLADNLPNTIMESMACGTPVVSFNVGGIPDMVRHMETGYLAKYKDADDFGRGIETLLRDSKIREKISDNCLEIARKEYNVETMAGRYVKLYEEIIYDFERKAKS